MELPDVEAREMEGMVRPVRRLLAPSSSGWGMSDGNVVSGSVGELVNRIWVDFVFIIQYSLTSHAGHLYLNFR